MSNPGWAFSENCVIRLIALLMFAVSAYPAAAQTPAERSAGTKAYAPLALSPPAPGPISPTDVVAVPPALLGRLQAEVMAPTRSRERRLDLLVQLLFAPEGLALEYDGSRTRTIDEAFVEHKANCLTF